MRSKVYNGFHKYPLELNTKYLEYVYLFGKTERERKGQGETRRRKDGIKQTNKQTNPK